MQLSPLRLGICLMFLKQISVKCGFPAMCIKRTTRMSIGNVFLARLLVRVVALRKLCQNVTKHVSNNNIKINHLASLLAKLFKQFQLPKHRFKQRQNARYSFHANCDHDISICNSKIQVSSVEKCLGVTISNTLYWDAHIDQLIKKSYSYSFVSSRIKVFLSRSFTTLPFQLILMFVVLPGVTVVLHWKINL